jgi:hypothetical protein
VRRADVEWQRQRMIAREALARGEALNEQLSAAERDARGALALLQQAQPGDSSSSHGRAYLALARGLSAARRGVEAPSAPQRALAEGARPAAPGYPCGSAAQPSGH